MYQISVSSSLKFGREVTRFRATVAHPFNYTLKQLEVRALSEQRGRKYNQQVRSWRGCKIQSCSTVFAVSIPFISKDCRTRYCPEERKEHQGLLVSKPPVLFPFLSITIASWQYLSAHFSTDLFWMVRSRKCTSQPSNENVNNVANVFHQVMNKLPFHKNSPFLEYIGNCNTSVKIHETRKALKYHCKVHLQSMYEKKRKNSTNHPSRSKTTEYFLSENALRAPGTPAAGAGEFLLSNKLCKLCRVLFVHPEPFWYLVVPQSALRVFHYVVNVSQVLYSEEFSCSVIIPLVSLIAVHDRPSAASRGDIRTSVALVVKVRFPCMFAWGLELPGRLEFHGVVTWFCPRFNSFFLHWVGIVLLHHPAGSSAGSSLASLAKSFSCDAAAAGREWRAACGHPTDPAGQVQEGRHRLGWLCDARFGSGMSLGV